jgi:hypothetical protein
VVRVYVWTTFRGVGVGYYPEQQFVHVDVRDQDTGWVDHASSGESARRVRFFTRAEGEAVPTPTLPAPLPVALLVTLAMR